MDNRYQSIQRWLEKILGNQDFSLTPASADASFRRYFRVSFINETPSKILMDAPPDKEDSQAFFRLARQLRAIDINVPDIYAENYIDGFFLLSDLGHEHFLSRLNKDSVDSLYEQAMRVLLTLQANGPADVPEYDASLLNTEMQLFVDWYLRRHLQLDLTDENISTIKDAFDTLTHSALQQPKVCVHRDFHSRNLMMPTAGPLSEPAPGVIDFQDAVYGPVTYDLVSLLRDCYIAWPEQLVYNKVAWYYQQAKHQELLTDVGLDQFIQWFDLMGIQRHLKAVGIFSRLNYRDNKPGYLDDIPRTLSYISAIAPKYPALHSFSSLLAKLIR